MGFELKIQKDQAEIRSVDSSQLAASFIDVVKQCVAKRILDITVNVSGVEGDFGQFKESVIKLNQFVASKGFKLKILGEGLDAPTREELQKSGLVVLRVAGLSPGFFSHIKAYEDSGKLPTDPSFLSDVEAMRLEFNDVRDRHEKLEAELKSFRVHKDVMMKSKISLESAKKELGKIQASGEKNKQNLEEISKSKAELARLTIQLEEEEKKYADFVKKSDAENKKKADSLKKETDAEKSRYSKLEQEFNKKSEARKLEMKKLQTPPPAKK
jgi:hypothetical protein